MGLEFRVRVHIRQYQARSVERLSFERFHRSSTLRVSHSLSFQLLRVHEHSFACSQLLSLLHSPGTAKRL